MASRVQKGVPDFPEYASEPGSGPHTLFQDGAVIEQYVSPVFKDHSRRKVSLKNQVFDGTCRAKFKLVKTPIGMINQWRSG